MCNGAIYDEDGGAHILHSEKVDALAELVEENSSENFLVAYNFKSDLERFMLMHMSSILFSTIRCEPAF
jgi:predicted GTPase